MARGDIPAEPNANEPAGRTAAVGENGKSGAPSLGGKVVRHEGLRWRQGTRLEGPDAKARQCELPKRLRQPAGHRHEAPTGESKSDDGAAVAPVRPTRKRQGR